MPNAVYHQSSFIGGEWSPLAQGRSDDPRYHTALNVCLNGFPVEEGAWTRRSGFQFITPTRGRTAAKLLPFVSDAALPYVMEFTNGYLSFYNGTGAVFTNDRRTVTASTLSAGALALTLDTNSTWSVGDSVMLWFPSSIDYLTRGPLQGRVYKLTAVADPVITLKDDLGNALTSPSTLADDALIDVKVFRMKRFTTNYATADLPNIRAVQAETDSIILSGAVAPNVLSITTAATGDSDAVFAFSAVSFVDGPYLDPQPGTLTVSGYSGSITATPNDGTTFTADDVGRHIRLYSEPAAWASGTTYTNGQTVTYAGEWWTFTYSSGLAGVIPGTTTTISGVSVLPWFPAPTAGQWAWGTITAQATTSCTVSLTTNLNSANGATISSWRLGLYTAGSYPTCGLYHEGRLWLAGAVQNRFDASMSNNIYTFSPTDPQGIVTDDSAISATLNADELHTVYWMAPDHQGILVGTPGGEWLISASQLNDPLTPTSIQAHKITNEQCANAEPRRAGISLIYVQRYARRLIEYLADTFSGRFSGRTLNEFAKHLTPSGIAEIAYQHELAPIIWARTNDGDLIGTTYRRVSRFVTEDPKLNGWHRHTTGGSRVVTSMCVTPNPDGLSDLLYVVTDDGTGTDHWVEVGRPIFEDA